MRALTTTAILLLCCCSPTRQPEIGDKCRELGAIYVLADGALGYCDPGDGGLSHADR